MNLGRACHVCRSENVDRVEYQPVAGILTVDGVAVTYYKIVCRDCQAKKDELDKAQAGTL